MIKLRQKDPDAYAHSLARNSAAPAAATYPPPPNTDSGFSTPSSCWPRTAPWLPAAQGAVPAGARSGPSTQWLQVSRSGIPNLGTPLLCRATVSEISVGLD